ncbi:hypothetical protein YC2023_084475 [Brassica napus]
MEESSLTGMESLTIYMRKLQLITSGAERLFKSRMKRRANENSTYEAECLFKKPAVVFTFRSRDAFQDSDDKRRSKIYLRGPEAFRDETPKLYLRGGRKTLQESYHTSKCKL